MSLLEIMLGTFVALFVFFGLCAIREIVIRGFIEEHCEVIDEMDPADPALPSTHREM